MKVRIYKPTNRRSWKYFAEYWFSECKHKKWFYISFMGVYVDIMW